MTKLSEIKLIDATAKDMARAFNYAMVKSKKTANVLTGKLQLLGPVTPYHVTKKLFPEDTFTKSGLLKPDKQTFIAKQMKNIFNPAKDIQEFNMMDFTNAIIKYVTKKF